MRAVLGLLRKELAYHRAYPLHLVSLAVGPFLIVAPFVFAARMYPQPQLRVSVAVGLVLWYWLSTFFWGVGFAIRDEVEEGVLESLAAAPAPLGTLLVAKAVDSLGVNLYITAAMLAWLRLLAGVTLPVWHLGFIAVMLAAAVSFTGVGVLYAALVLVTKQAAEVGNLSQEAMGILSGMTAPTSTLPSAVRWVSACLPLTYAIQGGRRVLAGEFPGTEILALVAFGAALLAVGWLVFARADRRLRATGRLGEF